MALAQIIYTSVLCDRVPALRVLISEVTVKI